MDYVRITQSDIHKVRRNVITINTYYYIFKLGFCHPLKTITH